MALIVTDQLGNSYVLSVDATTQALELAPAPGITPSPPGLNSITTTVQQLIVAALSEIGALAAGELPGIDDSTWVLQKLQRLIDRYNAREPFTYDYTFSTFSLIPNHQPHTIGPEPADFQVNQRPVDIPSIGLILLNSSAGTLVEVPLTKRDKDWWANQAIKGLTSTLPTDYYYDPAWPNGNIYFWPVPTAVNNVLIQQRMVITQVTSYNQSFSMPPAYWDAIVYPLAVSLCPSYEKQAGADLIKLAMDSVKAIQANNLRSPRLASDAPSQSSTQRARPDFSFLTGLHQ